MIDLAGLHTTSGQLLSRFLANHARAHEMATQTANTYQVNRARCMIVEAFPQGTDGISTAVIYRRFVEKFEAECEKNGVKVPSRGSINRALGRRK